jgi:hypothetical protein
MDRRHVALVVAAATGLCVMAAPAHADTGIACGYTFDAWAGGFSANLAMTNGGDRTVSGWTVRMAFPTATSGIGAWQAVMSQPDPYDATATNMSWNGVLAPGQTVSFGWTAKAATTGPPTSVTVNGVAC